MASGRGAAARPAFEAGSPVALGQRSRGPARVGDLVMVELRGAAARVVDVYGRVTSPRAAIAALMASEGLGRPFPATVLAEAEAGIEAAAPGDAGRRDLVAQRVITIDPEGAKDHDDAIAAQPDGDGVRLFVHIADVSRFVPHGGAIDREAARRATSVYLPGTVEPMLPPLLSTDHCSLRPGVERKVVTVELLVDAEGEVAESRFSRSLIRSERRLTYPEVDRLFDGVGLDDPALEADLRLALKLAERLLARRRRRGALEVATAEPVFRFEGDQVVAVHLEGQTPAHSLVEECMIAANEAVARYMIARGRPTVFRFHEDPAQSSVELLYERLEELGVPTSPLPEGPMAPEQRAAAAREAATAVGRSQLDERRRRAVSALVLRALRQAYYSPDQVGHSGLASPAYLHFTSPIRRYPDLLAHRALLDTLGIGEPGPDPASLAQEAEHSSRAERDAAALERRGDDICLAFLVRRLLAERGDDATFAGQVVGVGEGGLFVSFEEAFEGYLPARLIEGDFWRQDPLAVSLVGDVTGRRIRIGDPVDVQVADVEPLRGRVSLAPAGAERPTRPRRVGVRAGRRR